VEIVRIWRRSIKEEKGYFLLDALVAMVIFALAGLTTMTFFSVTISSVSVLRQETDATYLARQQIESLQQYDQNNYTRNNTAFWSTIIPSTSTKTLNGNDYTVNLSFIPASQMPAYTASSGIYALAAVSSNNDITPIRVVVSWTIKGRNRSIAMDAYLVK
jgi:type II secretory pathway pseudopilin PulG